MKNKLSVRVIIAPLVIGIAIVLGMFLGKYLKPEQPENRFIIYPRTDKLTNIINYISKEYVDEVDKNALVEKAIPQLLSDLDPHSQYIPASDLQEVNEPLEGNFSGIGVQFNMLNDTLMVIKTVANGPSEKVGIMAGDRFITVNDDTVAGVSMPSDSIVRKLKGLKGTKVNVGVLRKDVEELIPFTIERDNIPLYSIDVSYMINSNTGYIRISRFARTTHEEFSEAVINLLGSGMQKLILDLRGNGGGYLNATVKITDEFLSDNELIVYTKGQAREREEFRATKGGLCTDLDLVVLIDESTASASEILAGAIQDNDRGLIIGRRSFGKGLVQEQNVMADGSALRLTIARYYTPSGRCIQKSYENGNEEYYAELSARFQHGEFLEVDSIAFNDSLSYKTAGGRTVYGGGGIMPDIFVPIDTNNVTDYLVNIRNRGLIYKYALEYADNFRDDLQKMSSSNEVILYLKNKGVFNSFIKYAAKNGVDQNWQQIKQSHEIIETQLYAYIARNIFDNLGFYPIIEKIDNTLQEAVLRLKEDSISELLVRGE